VEEDKALKVILSARKRAQITGGILLGGILLVGVLGWIFWKWYAFVIGILSGLLLNFAYSVWQVRRIGRLTGLSPGEQESLLKKYAE